MVTIRKNNLRPIIDSFSGIHLTAYVVNDQKKASINRKIDRIIAEAKKQLAPVMSKAQMNKFLAPIIFLKEDDILNSKISGNFGLFRTENSFRILNIPISVEEICVIATTFHVKPLLRWIQNDNDFLFLSVEEKSLTLYIGNQNSIRLVDAVIFEGSINSHLNDIYFWVTENLECLKWDFKSPFFIAGNPKVARYLTRKSVKNNRSNYHAIDFYTEENFSETLFNIRNILKIENKKMQKLAILEFYNAEDLNIIEKDIFKIAKKSVTGTVKKLIIADGITVFGKLNRSTGDLIVHSKLQDHEDDDILDDLAQIVLANGGEVIVLPIEDIPNMSLVLAIVESTHLNELPLMKNDGVTRSNFAEVV